MSYTLMRQQTTLTRETTETENPTNKLKLERTLGGRTSPGAIIHSQNTCEISTLETYYLNFIASQLYTQKWQ